jgi:hypothetical protein
VSDGDQDTTSPGATRPAERRAHERVRLELTCYEAGKVSELVMGRTLNVSRNGALLLWNAPADVQVPTPGDPLNVDLELPPGARTERCIRCRGQVVRVFIPENQPPRVAVAIVQMAFATRSRPMRKRRLPASSARPNKPAVESFGCTSIRMDCQGAALRWIS